MWGRTPPGPDVNSCAGLSRRRADMAKKPADNNHNGSQGGEGPPHQNEPNPHDPAFDPARELGRQLARGIAFAAGKQVYEETAQRHLQSLIEWIHSLFT